MIGSLTKRISIFIIPALLLSAAYFSLPRIASVPAPWKELVPYLPLASIAIGIFLSLHFHRGRIFFVLLTLALFSWTCTTFLGGGTDGSRERMLFYALSLLLPLNITLFCFMREKGIVTMGGRMRMVFLAVQAAGVAWFIRYEHPRVEQFLSHRLFSASFLDRFQLPQVISLVLLLCFLLVFIRVLTRKSHLDSGLLGAVTAVGLACTWQATPDATLAFITAAGLTLALSVLQNTYNMAYRDELTGLQARRALNEQLMGLGRRYVVAMVDVDHFKRFNDTFGHDVGDQVLKMVAARIEGVKGGGKAYRYGGEEFTILFPRRQAADVIPYLEDLRKAIASYKVYLRSPDRPKKNDEGKNRRTERGGGDVAVSVTVSIGVAESSEGCSPSEVIRSADKALYRAKHKGRNQVCT